MLLMLITRLATALTLGLAAPAAAQAGGEDASAIRHLMMATFDTPEAPLTVGPVTVHKDIAVAGWVQGDMSGRALLRKKDGGWALTLCSGDALKEAASLRWFGLSEQEAEAMASAVGAAEASTDPALLARFATFDGIMMMDAEGHHPPAAHRADED